MLSKTKERSVKRINSSKDYIRNIAWKELEKSIFLVYENNIQKLFRKRINYNDIVEPGKV